MKKILCGLLIFMISFFSVSNFVFADTDECSDGIKLNTNVPFIGNCIGKSDTSSDSNGTNIGNAFPKLMGGLSKIIITLVLISALLMTIGGGVMMTVGGIDSGAISHGKKLIMRVVIAIALLGLSGMILYIINPNFFKI